MWQKGIALSWTSRSFQSVKRGVDKGPRGTALPPISLRRSEVKAIPIHTWRQLSLQMKDEKRSLSTATTVVPELFCFKEGWIFVCLFFIYICIHMYFSGTDENLVK